MKSLSFGNTYANREEAIAFDLKKTINIYK